MSEALKHTNNQTKEARRKAYKLYTSLGNFAQRRETQRDLEFFDQAWEGVEVFPVQFKGQRYDLLQDNVSVAALCGGIAIIGVSLVQASETLVQSPAQLYVPEHHFRILPPTLLQAGVQ